MPTHKTARYLLFGALYFAQGAILAYFTALNALYLLSFNLTMSQVGVFSAIALIPFVLKIFFGMLSDRVSLLGRGHRKPYIVLGLLIQATGLVIAPFIHPGLYYWEFALLAFILMAGMALYDTCTDGLALDTTPAAEQGTIQGVMVGGRALGVVVISAAIGALAQHTGWTVAFWTLAVNWAKLYPVLTKGGMIGVVLLAVCAILVWSVIDIPASGTHELYGLQVSNMVGKTVYVTSLVVIAFLCGSVQLAGCCGSLCKFEEPVLAAQDTHEHH
jgi:MFS family permease